MRYAQLVTGPAGCGKSTYCSAIAEHAANENKIIHVVNLDPAAEHFEYNPLVDVRTLIHIDDVMEDETLQLGPNGALVFCMEYLMGQIDWLKEQLGDEEDDYFVFDCPGQIELYTHLPIMRAFVDFLKNMNFNVCSIFMLDSQFMVDGAKFLSGTMTALSVMTNLELPHVNMLSKMDLLQVSARRMLDSFLEPDPNVLLDRVHSGNTKWDKKYRKLTKSIGSLIENYSLVRFHPLNVKDEESLRSTLLLINNAIQYGEDADVMTKYDGYDDYVNGDEEQDSFS